MSAKLTDQTVIKVNSEAFTKVQDNQLYILTYDSENMFILDETGAEIWNHIQKKTLTLSALIEICQSEYESFGKAEITWLKEFLNDLNKNELVTFS